jgi:hypothetical protein
MTVHSGRLYAAQLDLATPRQWTDLVPRPLLEDVARTHGGDHPRGMQPTLVKPAIADDRIAREELRHRRHPR